MQGISSESANAFQLTIVPMSTQVAINVFPAAHKSWRSFQTTTGFVRAITPTTNQALYLLWGRTSGTVLFWTPPASKAQTKTWLQFCRGKTSHLITRAEKMGLPLIWHLVIFVWERFLPCNLSSDKSGAKLWQNHSPWRPAGVFVSHTHQHHTGLESEGVGVQLTDCPPPSSEMQCIIRGGHLDKVVRWAEGIWWLV